MSKVAKKRPRTTSRPTGRVTKNTFTSKSGKTVKIHRNISERAKGWKDNWLQHKASRLAGMPKGHLKRFLFRLKPSNLYHYWFSREGAIMALKVTGIGIITLFILIVGLFAYLRKDLPAVNNIYGQNLGGSISYFDSTGQTLLWEDYDAVKRIPVPSTSISPYMKAATVAIEDKNFYHEGAFDVGAILRSAFHDATSSGGGLQGGSTITQQLVKLNENWTDNRTIFRKVKEVILASELEREYSKDDILTGYLNIAPYGGVEYGVQTAAQDYFNTSAKNLTLAQSTMLAAIPQAPDIYSPYSPDFNQQALIGRDEYILDQMVKQGMITKAQATAAKSVDVLSELQPPQSKYAGIQAPYFVLAAKAQLESQYGTSTVERGGWKVITTLNLAQQNEAESLVAKNLPNVLRNNGDEEAMVAENVPTGQVTALVGGVNFNNPSYGQINYATLPIEPGSSYKLYDYTALINDNNNVGAGSVLYDIQQPLPGYPCTNKAHPLQGGNCLWDYDFRYPGAETIRYAMAGSRNVPAVKALLINGEAKTIALSEQMGLTSGYDCYSDVELTQTTTCYGSAAIGDGAYLKLNEHVNGFATDSRLGNYVPQTFILKITDSTGKTVYQWTQPKPDQVVKPDAAYIIDNIISDPRASYLPGSCTTTTCTPLSEGGYKFQRYNGWDIAVKTGTTNDNYDGLMMAMTTQYAVGTWVGYHTREQALVAGQMEYLTEPLARGFIQYVSTGKPVNWAQPAGIQTLPAYVVTNHVGLGSEEPSPSTDLFPSWYNPPTASKHSYTVDVVSGDLATNCTPALAKKYISSGYNANVFSVDTFENGGDGAAASGSYNTTQNDNVHLCSDSPPTVSLQSSDPLQCSNGTCSVSILVTQGTHPLTSNNYPLQVNALVDGSAKSASCSFVPGMDPNNSPQSSDGTCSFSYSSSGSHQVSVQVIDSVLYTGTSSTTESINIPVLNTPSVSGNSVSFNWSDTGSSDYTLSFSGTPESNTCTDAPTNSCTATFPAGNYTATVTDNSTSETGPSVSFSSSGP